MLFMTSPLAALGHRLVLTLFAGLNAPRRIAQFES